MEQVLPGVEHARAAIEAGDVVMVQSDFFDPIDTIQAAPLAFGARAAPMAVTVVGHKASAAIMEYRGDKCPETPPDLADRLFAAR